MRKFIFPLVLFLGAVLASCSSDPDSYENLLADQKEAISKFIDRNNIDVRSHEPEDWSVVGENVYYKTADGLYIHLVDTGDVGGDSDIVQNYQLIIARYNKITLDVVPDTIVRYWNSIDAPYPYEFNYLVGDGETSDAFHAAVSIMKRNNAVAKLIVPSKLGTDEDEDAVKAYYYDFKIQLGD